MHRDLNCNKVQTSAFSVSARKQEMSRLVVAVQAHQGLLKISMKFHRVTPNGGAVGKLKSATFDK